MSVPLDFVSDVASAASTATAAGPGAEALGIPVVGLRDIQVFVTPAMAFASARRALEALATSRAVSQPKQELDPLLVVRADKVIVDLVRQAARLGDLQHVCAPNSTVSAANLHGELGAVLLNTCAGRESSTERIVCDLTGTGAQDAAIAEAVWTAYQAAHATHAAR